MEVLLLRHAQAVDGHGGHADFDRPLSPEGERQADRIGQRLASFGLRPDLIITSPARRAKETARRAAVGLGIPASAILSDERIYGARLQVLSRILEDAAVNHSRILMVGHNPGCEQLAIRLGTLPSGWAFPNACVARFEVPDAAALRKGIGCRLIELLDP